MRTLLKALTLLPFLACVTLTPMNLNQNSNAVLDRVTVRVDTQAKSRPFSPAWSWFGYDEPNYTYAPNGRKLLKELGALSPAPTYIRTHNLLTTGDGSYSLKWGSTNAYTEDAAGNPVYDWKIVDKIFDTYREAHVRPMVEIGFMPEALSIKPHPYRHNFPNGPIWTGWAYPPRDYGKWAELVYQWVKHSVKRYGKKEVETWLWEVWNEPDIAYWQGTHTEYFKLYDYAIDAVKRALPSAHVGGPDATGGAFAFLREFLEHCRSGTNYATGKVGSPLEFIAFHPKGAPKFHDGHVQMGLDSQLRAIDRQFEVIASFPEYQHTPVILGESDPEGCAACSAQTHPENGYREGPLYGAYTAVALHSIYALAEKRNITLQGVVTWAFEFEGQPYFAGFRELATNGIDKPVLNVFKMFGKLQGERIALSSDRRIDVEDILHAGVRNAPDINGMATLHGETISILLWNYHDDDLPAPDALLDLTVSMPKGVEWADVRHYRVDKEHSNAWEAWKKMGSPQPPNPAQYRQLEAAGQLQQIGDVTRSAVKDGAVHLEFHLPRQGVSLLQLQGIRPRTKSSAQNNSRL